MAVSGRAFELKTRLKRLAAQHGVVPTAAYVDFAPHTPFPQLLAGVCSDITTIDGDRLQMTKGALSWNPAALPPLLYRHQPNVIAGRVLGLKWFGPQLLCAAWVGHPVARRCQAFSVSVRVDDAEIINAQRADYFGRILRGEIVEISMTSEPANVNSVVRRREPSGAEPAWEEELGLLQKEDADEHVGRAGYDV